MTETPERLAGFLALLSSLESRQDRIELLIDTADRFREVPPEVAQRPFDSLHLIPNCESEAYFWPVARDDGTLDLFFAVENPQGISARAMAVVLSETLSGQPLEVLAGVSDDLPYEIFGRELSMGKNMGLNGMISMVRLAARKRLAEAEVDPQRK
jgi:cysteine desulfuration protein SufE